MIEGLRKSLDYIRRVYVRLTTSRAHIPAWAALAAERRERTRNSTVKDPLRPPIPTEWPPIDIGIVTYNSQHWVAGFVESLLALDYPKERITLRFVDNRSTDATEAELRAALPRLSAAGYRAELVQRPNRGYGASNNIAWRAGHAPFCLVTNIDLTFEKDCLRRVVATALADHADAAAWELRQKPYEYPKFYDPVTGSTNWNSHACVLLRRSALEKVGGYDETLFMYGEDVELSYRLRRSGYRLRYCPTAVIWHYSFSGMANIKPVQHLGIRFANLYLRLKYGNIGDATAVLLMAAQVLITPPRYPGSRRQMADALLKLLTVSLRALRTRQRSRAHFPFHTWDYDICRDRLPFKQRPPPTEYPLVSLITRTRRGREQYLRQALLSGAHQTWPHLEHIVVEDDGDTMRDLVGEVALATDRTLRFIANDKTGRSSAGNAGLAAARGRWCLFLDDNNLLFAEHIEILAGELLENLDAVASHSRALKVTAIAKKTSKDDYLETPYVIAADSPRTFDISPPHKKNARALQFVLFERRLFVERGGFDEDLDALGDWALWNCYAHGCRTLHVPKTTAMVGVIEDPADTEPHNRLFETEYPRALARVKARIAR